MHHLLMKRLPVYHYISICAFAGKEFIDAPYVMIIYVSVHQKYDYVFAENGLMAFKDGNLIAKQVSINYLVLPILFEINYDVK